MRTEVCLQDRKLRMYIQNFSLSRFFFFFYPPLAVIFIFFLTPQRAATNKLQNKAGQKIWLASGANGDTVTDGAPNQCYSARRSSLIPVAKMIKEQQREGDSGRKGRRCVCVCVTQVQRWYWSRISCRLSETLIYSYDIRLVSVYSPIDPQFLNYVFSGMETRFIYSILLLNLSLLDCV